MKLQLTVFAQDLKEISEEGGCNPFAVVAQPHDEPGKKPTILGRTETLRNTLDPDFTKIFILHDFELGKEMYVLVTLYDAKNTNQSLGSAMFNVGTVLGTKGGFFGKELKSGGYIMLHVERTSGLGTFNLKLRGLDLVSNQDQVDPYFELQKKRKTTEGKTVWDAVFRSIPVEDSTDPIWSESSIDFGTLCGGKKKQKFRISVKDYDDSDDTLIGSCFVTVDQLLKAITSGADAESKDDIDTEKAMKLMRPNPFREVGKLLVVDASIGDAEPEEPDIVFEEEEESSRATTAADEEDDIVLEATDDIEIAAEEVEGGANFADYIAGGCQLKVIVAIDYTASNGDPRKEDSLHYFSGEGMNAYEETISTICSILSEYDSDHKYPVYGFGAKKDGELNHCFPVGDEKEVEGVDGILTAYKDAFKGGIAMSKPTDITQVIKAAGRDAKQSLDNVKKDGKQEYSILTVFTNGTVHSVEETIEAITSAKEDPLSIIIVGVGPGDFADMDFLNELQKKGERVHFVDTKEHTGRKLTEATLQQVPEQLASYFTSKGIKPNPPEETDEIVIEPFDEDEEKQGDVVVSENGDISVEGDVKPPSKPQGPSIPAPVAAMGGKGKNFVLKQAKKQFGRVSKHMERSVTRMINQSVNKVFGIPNVTGRRRGKRR